MTIIHFVVQSLDDTPLDLDKLSKKVKADDIVKYFNKSLKVTQIQNPGVSPVKYNDKQAEVRFRCNSKATGLLFDLASYAEKHIKLPLVSGNTGGTESKAENKTENKLTELPKEETKPTLAPTLAPTPAPVTNFSQLVLNSGPKKSSKKNKTVSFELPQQQADRLSNIDLEDPRFAPLLNSVENAIVSNPALQTSILNSMAVGAGGDEDNDDEDDDEDNEFDELRKDVAFVTKVCKLIYDKIK